MLDIKFIRENPDLVKDGIRKKREFDALPLVDELIDLDERRRRLLSEIESLRSRQKKLAKEVGRAKAHGQDAADLLAKSADLAGYLKKLEAEEKDLALSIQRILPQIPNLPHPSAPPGESEADNVVVKEWGEKPSFDFEPKPHWDIAGRLGIIDFERGAKVSGSGFPFYVGQGARLVRALENLFLDFHSARGFVEVRPPLLVREQAAFGTGQIPDKEGMMYQVSGGYYLIPTSEVPVTNLHAGEILEAERLPLKYTAYTPNFRVEAGSYGKDVRGLNRLHQFDKVEMVVFSRPEESYDWLEKLTRQAEELLELLGLPYRRLLMCTADMGFTQAKKYDLEVWSAGQQKWLEVSSISNMEDYQARRLKTRYRKGDAKPRLVHTLNGSGLAFPRVMAAIIENYQDASGGFSPPDALAAYL